MLLLLDITVESTLIYLNCLVNAVHWEGDIHDGGDDGDFILVFVNLCSFSLVTKHQ